MNFITKPLSNTNVYSDKLQIVKSKKTIQKTDFLQLYIFRENGPYTLNFCMYIGPYACRMLCE